MRSGAKRGRRSAMPHQPAGMALLPVVMTGLAAAGIAGFATVAALLEDEAPRVERVSAESPNDAAPFEPLDEEQASADLAENPLYDSGELPDAECSRPELDAKDAESMDTFLNSMADCLDETWAEQFAEGQLGDFEPPVRHFWTANGQSPCGSFPAEGRAAFYCEMNQGLYLGVEDIVDKSHDSDQWEAYAMLISHEYAHHVQSEAGILNAYRAQQSREDGSAASEAWTRRSELQANCLGGAFLGAGREGLQLDEDSEEDILADARARADSEDADERTHGTVANGDLWTHHGFDRMDPAACNTWDAKDDLVE